jgi:hypothetical protein
MTRNPASDKIGCPGVTEIRPITSRLYGIRVRRGLISKLKGVSGLMQGKPGSDLFCVEVGAQEPSAEEALRRFREIVAGAGLGPHFGMRAAG